MQNQPLSDEHELLAKLATKDERAFKTVYEKFNRRIYTVSVKMLQSTVLAEEITQEVFLKLWRHGQLFNSFNHLEAWLRTTTRNLSLNAFRKIVLEKKIDKEFLQNFKETHHETEESIVLSEARNAINDAIHKLPTKQREVYLLCQKDGLKYEEVSEALQISVNTVKTHMKRALTSIRTHLKDHIDLVAIFIVLKLF